MNKQEESNIFDLSECCEYISSHGFGDATNEGIDLARVLFSNGIDYATIGHEIVARELTE